jgi:hypothetical protein
MNDYIESAGGAVVDVVARQNRIRLYSRPRLHA